MLGLIARLCYVSMYVNSKLAVCIWDSKVGGWLTEEFLSFMRSIKLVVVQSTWLSLVASYISFNQVSPCIMVWEAVLWVFFNSCNRKSSMSPDLTAHWSKRGSWMCLSALLNQGQHGWHYPRSQALSLICFEGIFTVWDFFNFCVCFLFFNQE